MIYNGNPQSHFTQLLLLSRFVFKTSATNVDQQYVSIAQNYSKWSEWNIYFFFYVLSRIVTRLLSIVSRGELYNIVTTNRGDKKLLTILWLAKRGNITLIFVRFQRTERRKNWKSYKIIFSVNIVPLQMNKYIMDNSVIKDSLQNAK